MKNRLFIVLILSVSLSGCILASRNWAIGQGARKVEYFEDGSIKKEEIESKILPDLSLIKIPQ